MLDISNVINVSVSQAPVGLASFNPNNVCLFTKDAFLANPNADLYRVYVSAQAVGTDFGISSETYAQAAALFAQQPNILNGGGVLIIAPLTGSLEVTYAAVQPLVYFNGIISTNSAANATAFAATVQAQGDKMWINPSNSQADILGAFQAFKNSVSYGTRCVFYSTDALNSRLMAAAYAGKGFSTDFTASNGTKTMNLKQLTSITPDGGITQTIYGNCATAGVDIYVQYGTVPAVVSNGANKFFDQVYNQIWLVNSLKVAGFNYLASAGNKVPQTEDGMNLLKGAYRSILEQAVANAYIAPGSWTAPDTFGKQTDFLANIAQRGYYIYSAPVSQQLAADRAARKAPLIQIAIKEAGAVHSSNIVINVNP